MTPDPEPQPHTSCQDYAEDHAAWERRQRDRIDPLVALYLADANGTTYALMRLGDVPTDGTWEVMHRHDNTAFTWMMYSSGWVRAADRSVLVIARPRGADAR